MLAAFHQDQVHAASQAQRHRALDRVRQALHQRSRHPAHAEMREKRMRQFEHPGAKRIFVTRYRLAQVTQLDERTRQSRHGRARQPGALGQVLVAEKFLRGCESAQYGQPTGQRGGKVRIDFNFHGGQAHPSIALAIFTPNCHARLAVSQT